MRPSMIRTTALATAIAASSLAFVGCTTTTPSDRASTVSSAKSVDGNVDAALSRLYSSVPGSRELVARSAGVLVFPDVKGASFVIGGEGGKGALRSGGRTLGYYSLGAASLGFQAGVQSKSIIYVFTTQDALNKFVNSNGWTAGVDANVAAGKLGANGSIDTESAKAPVVSFVMNNAGLEAGVAVQGAKITRVAP